jgi:ABC-type multidrug transport system ATPase subunit
MKPIINGVSGQVKAGECLALMGASGAGKTTLLNILAGRITKDKDNDLSGEVLFNGKSYSLNEISSFSGYVLQSDILIEFLTVKETLQFGANLKIKGTEEQKQHRADKLISEFKLEGTENTLVGGQFVKGISGGQKKRVNIALELISDPPVLFLDEPTSGLDSYTSEIVIKKLDELAKQFNKTIIYVIHQPSSDIFKQMDKLMLLYKGKAIYYGGAGQTAVDYFGKIGFKCETDMNPSDFFMYIMQSKNQDLGSYLDTNYLDKVGVVIDSKRQDKIEYR